MDLQQRDTRICSDPCAGPCAGCPDRIVCRCLQVTEETISDAIVTLGLRTVRAVTTATGAGDGCTCCHNQIRELLTAPTWRNDRQESVMFDMDTLQTR